MHHLKTRAQFQAALAGDTIARSAHFALHRLMLDDPDRVVPGRADAGPASRVGDLFAVQAPAASASSAAPQPWVGAMVPKRWARRAVTRNAIRRQVYAASAACETRLPHAAHVVRLRAAFDRTQFISASSDRLKQAVRAELEQLLARALT